MLATPKNICGWWSMNMTQQFSAVKSPLSVELALIHSDLWLVSGSENRFGCETTPLTTRFDFRAAEERNVGTTFERGRSSLVMQRQSHWEYQRVAPPRRCKTKRKEEFRVAGYKQVTMAGLQGHASWNAYRALTSLKLDQATAACGGDGFGSAQDV
jgi:hypothetical protein